MPDTVDGIRDARRMLAEAQAGRLKSQDLPQRAAELAEALLRASRAHQSRREMDDQRRLAAMMDDPVGKAFTVAMADRVLRAPTPAQAAVELRRLLRRHGTPAYLGSAAGLALRVAAAAALHLPQLVVGGVESVIRTLSSRVILDGAQSAVRRHIRSRHQAGVQVNLNQLGEAVLGEAEAAHRLEQVCARIHDPSVDYVSVKLSALYSQASALAHAHTVDRYADRLRVLLVAASARPGSPVFVNLDMEEYRDLRPTLDAFMRVLAEKDFHTLPAGLVLQAYLPDAHAALDELIAWSKRRQAAGGSWVRLRLVKGANLAMERVDAELHDWPLATYASKPQVDASFKLLLDSAIKPEHAQALRFGVGSHNLFDIAYALLLREHRRVAGMVSIEMLEGMAEGQALALAALDESPRLYAPVVARDEFTAALAYLVRRLDENTHDDNYLRHAFALDPGSPAWMAQRLRFLTSCHDASALSTRTNRDQDRSQHSTRHDPLMPFRNVADSDWTSAANRHWISSLLNQPQRAPARMQIAGSERDGVLCGQGAHRWHAAGAHDVADAIDCAISQVPNWHARGFSARRAMLMRVADVFGQQRGELIAVMVAEGNKTVAEADSEVSEAVDFAAYYARSFDSIRECHGLMADPIGPVVIAPPWNFPCAIPASGILAALIAGNTVIVKPAPETVHIAQRMVACCWEAGIPREVLQFVPCQDDEHGRALISDQRLGAVVLTGAWETARMFLSWRPDLRLIAETSGKNALAISASADADLAVRDLVRSAFGHAGQKCSAASLALVAAPLHDAPQFLGQLRDAAASLLVGLAADPATIVPPLIRAPGPNLLRALTTLDPGESWLLEPRQIDGDPCRWTPGIRIGVRPDSWFARTECFGPVLGVIRVNDVDEALAIQNAAQFGLTAGLHSLDEDEIASWGRRIAVGNAYINRGITGALVQRQPFGGWRRSSVGPGAKAGGPNYVWQLVRWRVQQVPTTQQVPTPAATQVLQALGQAATPMIYAAAADAARWWRQEFAVEHDPAGLIAERNLFRYRPLVRLIARIGTGPEATAEAVMLLAVMAASTPVKLVMSVDAELHLPEALTDLVECHAEDEAAFISRIIIGGFDRVRLVGVAGAALRLAILDVGASLAEGPVVPYARIELLPFVREQSLSVTAHRYGTPTPVGQTA